MKTFTLSFITLILLCSFKPPKKVAPQNDILYSKYGGDVDKMMRDLRMQDSMKYPFLYNLNDEAKNDSSTASEEQTKILDYADELPAFPNGTAGINDYIQGYKLNIPDSLTSDKANVEVKFYVNTTGTTQDPVIIKTTNTKFDAFTRWLIYDMPTWTPAKQSGKTVNCYVTLKITYGQ